MQALILPFNIDSVTLEQAGGKGMNLARTTRGGFPVPPGFIIPTPAYRAFTQANRIDTVIADVYRSLDPEQPESLDVAAEAIRRVFEAGRIPPELESAILEAYRSLAGQTGGTSYEGLLLDDQRLHPRVDRRQRSNHSAASASHDQEVDGLVPTHHVGTGSVRPRSAIGTSIVVFVF